MANFKIEPKTVILLHREYKDNSETLGYLYVVRGKEILGSFCTVERPWLNNKRNVSCIPTGRYVCHKRNATNAIKYQHILLEDVPDRSGIAIHKGNYVRNSEGCILVNNSFSDIDSDNIIDGANSKIAFDKFMSLIPDGNLEIFIF